MKPDNKSISKKRRKIIILFAAVAVVIIISLAANLVKEEEKSFRSQVRKSAMEWFPDAAEKVTENYGLHLFPETRNIKHSSTVHTVVLIHGLDDPGKVWMNLAPELSRQEYDVWIMTYPNDQPVRESAAFFFDQLKLLKGFGASRIDIVAHSMGGLVSREMLTSPAIRYRYHVAQQAVPEVTQLIMVGTPNHGAPIARFRFLAEFRDQWVNLTEGSGHWLRWLFDGAGEAKIDLLPGSLFLNELNDRPNPENTIMYIIAGSAAHWDKLKMDSFMESVTDILPEQSQKSATDLEEVITAAAGGLGDGLVPVDSTRLEGVEHRIVPGTHLSMIRNITAGSTRMPPAIPLIIQRLKLD